MWTSTHTAFSRSIRPSRRDWRWSGPAYPPMQPLLFEDFKREMEAVDRAIVFGVRAVASGNISPDEYTAEWVSNDPEKLDRVRGGRPDGGRLSGADGAGGDRSGPTRLQDLPDAGAIQSGRSDGVSNVRDGGKAGTADSLPHGSASRSAGRYSSTASRCCSTKWRRRSPT